MATIRLYSKTENKYIDVWKHSDRLMAKAGLIVGLGFEDFGVQSSGQVVIMDKCGNFGYLSTDEFSVHYSTR